MSIHKEKGTFWTKVRSSTKNISSSIANLSIRSEHDGDTPESTLIHKSLVHYYDSQEPFQGFPQWLGEPVHTDKHALHHASTAPAAPQGVAQGVPNGVPQDPQFAQHGAPLQQQQQQQQQQNHHSGTGASKWFTGSRTAPPIAGSRTPTSSQFKSIYNSTNEQSVENEQGRRRIDPSAATAAGRTSSSGSALMRDRLKKTNYRSNFGV